eukprot:2907278-Amphidinium_carterae.2
MASESPGPELATLMLPPFPAMPARVPSSTPQLAQEFLGIDTDDASRPPGPGLASCALPKCR